MAQNIRVQKTFEALFALEDIREIFRGTLPTGLSETEEQEFQKKVSDLKEIINELESGKGNPKVRGWQETFQLETGKSPS